MNPEEALRRINKAFAVDQVSLCVLVGTGLAMSATESDDKSSWPGLIRHGARTCVDVGTHDEEWFLGVDGDVERGDYLPAAEKVTEGLGGRDGDEFRRWLREGPGSLTARRTEMLGSLRRLFDSRRVSVVTTNYDDLMSRFFTRDQDPIFSVTLSQPGFARDAFLGRDRAVVHVHGHWRDPRSIVFGSSSYARILDSAPARTFMQQLLLGRMLLFVGTGAGVADPNFASLFDWAKEAIPGSTEAFLLRTSKNPNLAPTGVHDVEVPDYDDVPAWLDRIALPTPRVTLGLDDDGRPTGEGPHPAAADAASTAAVRDKLEDIARWAANETTSRRDLDARRFVALFGDEIKSTLAGLDPAAETSQREIALAWATTLLDTWLGTELDTA